ncbi:MAG: zinc-binding alcohol dehydrogenase family protein [Solirubrobacteraceae bacterium]
MPNSMAAIGSYDGLPIEDARSLVDLELAVPTLRPRDVLVRVQAVSVNPVDVKRRAALEHDDAPTVLGYDAAGIVEATGAGVETLQAGDEVWYAGDVNRQGSNAELQAVDERIVACRPGSLSFAEAAALPLTTITAWEALFERLRLTASSEGTLLIVGGAGGVGSVMIQLAKQLTRLRVLATASRPESRDWVCALGADQVVDHRDLVDSVRAHGVEEVDYVFSPHSAGNIEAYAELLRPFGEIVAIDEPPGLELLPLKAKSIAWHWELMFTRPMFETDDISQHKHLLSRVAELVDEQRIRTTMTESIEDFSAAGMMTGKVVVHR